VIRPATAGDAPALYRICLLTGDAGRDASGLYRDSCLLGDVYVGPYLHVHPSVALIAEQGPAAPLGYALGTPDSAALAAACERHWWPAVRARHQRPPAAGHPRPPAEQLLVDLVHDPVVPDPDLLAQYPAHLHVDLLPEAQGRGLGRALMADLMAALAAAGARGVHLGVDPRNRSAIAFYEHLGFRRWQSADETPVLVCRLS
jgi:GNAT superfamily N-acetyltransferase